MRLEFAFLANSADLLQDNRLFAVGIGIDGLLCSGFPINTPIYAALKISYEVVEFGNHLIAVELTKPDGIREPVSDHTIEANPNKLNPNKVSVTVILAINAHFETAGMYTFHILIDGKEEKSLSLDTKLITPELTDKTP